MYQSLIPEALSRSSDFQWERSTNYKLKQKNQYMHKGNITMSEHQEKELVKIAQKFRYWHFRKEYKMNIFKRMKIKIRANNVIKY